MLPRHTVALLPLTSVRERLRQTRLWPSILGTRPFGWWVVTHSLADADYQGHRPAVFTSPTPYCHEFLNAFDAHAVQSATHCLLTRPCPLVPMITHLPVSKLRVDPRPTFAASLTYSKLLTMDRFPKRNFGGNQQLARSIGLSPLRAGRTSDLRVSTATDLHRRFQRLHPAHA